MFNPLAQGESLTELAADAGWILMLGDILRYHPAVMRLREMIQQGVSICRKKSLLPRR